jgi:peptide/nickel transport system substrate-binding protein
MRKTRSTWVAILLTAMLAAACGGDDDDGSDAASTDSTAEEAAGEATERDPNGTVRFSTFYEPSRMDPHRASNAGDANALFLTFDRLFHLNPDAEPIAGLVEEWEYQEDGTLLELHLRPDVVFHDGEPFDAAAVAANLERARTVEGSVVVNDLAVIEAVEVVDDLTVELRLTQPSASLLAVLSDRAGAMMSPKAFDKPDRDQMPVGAGMYRVVQYLPGNRIVYERFEDYWDPEAVGAQRFEYVLMGDTTSRLAALVNGEVDVATLEPSQVAEAEAAGLQVSTETTVVYQQMYMNRAAEPFDDVRVRQALNYAIDREAIVETLDFGYGEPNSQIFPEGYWAHDPETGTDHYTYDPERSRELLAEAGYEDGLSFEMLLPTPGTPPALAEVLQAQFAEVGVDISILQTPAQGVADLFFIKKQGVAMLGVWSGRQDPSMTTSLRWTATGFSNPGGHTTPEVEALNAEALATLDPDERAEVMHELVRTATEEAFDLVIYNPVTVVAATDDVVELPSPYLNGKFEFRGTAVRP